MWNLHSSTITTLPWICSQSLNDMLLNTALYDYDSCLQCLVNVVIMATWVNTLPYSCHVVTCACMSVHILYTVLPGGCQVLAPPDDLTGMSQINLSA